MIETERLLLLPGTEAHLRAALAGNAALARSLDVEVPPTWPPETLDAAALGFLADRLHEAPAERVWWMHFVLQKPEGAGRPLLIGGAGYKGPPEADGTVEAGYGIVSDRHRRGFATEALRALVAAAFAHAAVKRVVAETFPDHVASIGVLEKCGFRRAGEGREPGTILFEMPRAAWAAPGSRPGAGARRG